MQKHINILELGKILKMLADNAICEEAKQKATEIMPSSNLDSVNRLIKNTDDAHMLIGRFGSPGFLNVKNIKSEVKRASVGAMLSMRELLSVAQVLSNIRIIKTWRNRCENVDTSLDFMFETLTPNLDLENRIKTAIISEEEMSDNASPELANIRRKIARTELRIRDNLDNMIKSAKYQKYLQEAIVTIRDGRFVVPVKAEHKNEIKGLVHDTSSSGATLFIEPMSIVEANNDIRVLKSREQDEIERILFELSGQVGDFYESISSDYDVLVELDLIFAKAKLAYSMKASVPLVNDEGIIELYKARHPLIDAKKIVPTDIRLGGEFNALIVTGPNTGGKTVTLKTLGLLTLMAMCGLMLPVYDNSKISIFDKVFADIGDEQSIEQSLSTFSSHMTNIISILNETDDKTLVLIDELGAGTDPVEGAALARAILENLISKGCRIAATTHYAELKIFALETEGVENACCEFNVETLSPTYKLLIGVPGRSNAFAISERLGLSKNLTARAKELISTEDTRFETVVSQLETSRLKLEQERDNLRTLKIEAERNKKQSDEFLNKLNLEKEKVIAEARQKAKQIVDDVKRESAKIIDELDEIRRQKESAEFKAKVMGAKGDLKSRLSKLTDVSDPVVNREDDNYVLPRPLKIGDTVLIYDVDKKGTLASLDEKSGKAVVEVGIMKIKADVKNLRLIEEKPKPTKSYTSTRNVKSKKDMQIKTEVDLRGMDSVEAIYELDKFIDDAILSGVNIIWIIHGKGTGVLRKATHAHLKSHKAIKSFRLGIYGEGEDGVTIAELK